MKDKENGSTLSMVLDPIGNWSASITEYLRQAKLSKGQARLFRKQDMLFRRTFGWNAENLWEEFLREQVMFFWEHHKKYTNDIGESVKREVGRIMDMYKVQIDQEILDLVDIAEPTIEIQIGEELNEVRGPVPVKLVSVHGRLHRTHMRIVTKKLDPSNLSKQNDEE